MKPDTRFLARPEIRAQTNPDGTITFEGYAAVFDSESCDMGGFVEIIAPNAFNRCLSTGGADIRCLQNHDSNRVLGRTTAGTLRLRADAKGLAFECKAQPTTYARDLGLNVAAKEVSGCSFRFYMPEGGDTWVSTPDGRLIRTLTDVEIDEISLVTFPAYKATELSVRSAERRDEARAAFQPATTPQPPPDLESTYRRRLARIAAASL